VALLHAEAAPRGSPRAFYERDAQLGGIADPRAPPFDLFDLPRECPKETPQHRQSFRKERTQESRNSAKRHVPTRYPAVESRMRTIRPFLARATSNSMQLRARSADQRSSLDAGRRNVTGLRRKREPGGLVGFLISRCEHASCELRRQAGHGARW